MRITAIFIVERNFVPFTRCWTVELHSGDTTHVCSVVDPFGATQYRELQWYLEEYATDLGSPFDTDRAEACRSTFKAYARKLAQSLDLESRVPRDGAIVVLHIHGQSEQSAIFDLLWEVLEELDLWKTEDSLPPIRAKIIVRRSLGTGNLATHSSLKTIECPSLNILFVTSRPRLDSDVGHRLISKRLFETVKRAQESSYPVRLYIVRPGTWSAVVAFLKKQTAKHGQGFFHVAHIDVHGRTIIKPEAENVYLEFLRSLGQGAYLVEANVVARELYSHGIKVAFLNACRSAKTGNSVDSNIATTFVNVGFAAVAAMSYNVTGSAAAIGTEAFYQALMDGEDFASCAWAARNALRQSPDRVGRFGVTVRVADWPILVAYSSDLIAFKTLRPTVMVRAHKYLDEELFGAMKDLRSTLIIIFSFSLWLWMQPLVMIVSAFSIKLRDSPPLIGRDDDILSLENTFLIPYQHPETGRRIRRRIIFIHGWGGVGKSTLLNHLAFWWKETGLVEESFSFQFDSIFRIDVDRICSTIYFTLFGFHRAEYEEMYNSVIKVLKSKRYLLILDNLNAATRNNKIILSETSRARLVSFIAELRDGETFVMLASRRIEDWIIVPRGQIWHYHLQGLTAQACMQYSDSVVESKGHRLQVKDDVASAETTVQLFKQFDNLPLAVELLSGVMARINAEPTYIYSIFSNGLILPLKRISVSESNGSRILDVIRKKVIGNVKRIIADSNPDEEIFPALILKIFGERNHELLWLFPLFVSTHCVPEGLTAFLISGSRAARDFSAEPDGDVPILDSRESDEIQKVLKLETILFEYLTSLDLLHKQETKASDGSVVARRWIMHPLLSYEMKDYFYNKLGFYPNVDKTIRDKVIMPFWYAFSSFYHYRARNFVEQTLRNPAIGLLCTRQELRNILNASKIYNDSHAAPSLYFLELLTISLIDGQLGEADLEAIIRMVIELLERLEDVQNDTAFAPFDEKQLTYILFGITRLVSFYAAISAWSDADKYVTKSQLFMAKNIETASKIEGLASEISAQASTIKAWRLYGENRLKDAAAAFKSNLTQDVYSDTAMYKPVLVNINYLKFSNLHGLARTLPTDPTTSSEELTKVSEALRDLLSSLESQPAEHQFRFTVELARNSSAGRLNFQGDNAMDTLRLLSDGVREKDRERRSLAPYPLGSALKKDLGFDFGMRHWLRTQHNEDISMQMLNPLSTSAERRDGYGQMIQLFQRYVQSTIGARDPEAATTFLSMVAKAPSLADKEPSRTHIVPFGFGTTVRDCILIDNQKELQKSLMTDLTESMRRGDTLQKQAEYHEWAFSSAVHEDNWSLAFNHYQQWHRLLSRAIDISKGYWHVIDEIRLALCNFHLIDPIAGIEQMKAVAPLAEACGARSLKCEALELVARLQKNHDPSSTEAIVSYCRAGLSAYVADRDTSHRITDYHFGDQFCRGLYLTCLDYVRATCEVGADGTLRDLDFKALECLGVIKEGVGDNKYNRFATLLFADPKKWIADLKNMRNLDILEEALFA